MLDTILGVLYALLIVYLALGATFLTTALIVAAVVAWFIRRWIKENQ